MAEANATKRNALKKVDGEKMAVGVYHAVFTSGLEFTADVRDLPIVDADGKIVEGRKFGDEGWNALPPMAQRIVAYGLKQKLDDSMAGADDEKEALDEVQSTWDAILKNGWTLRVAGEGVEGGLFARAYAEVNGISLSDAKGKIAGLVERNLKANREKLIAAGKQKEADELTDRMVFNKVRDAALEKNPDLKAKYDEFKAKKAKKAKAKSEIEVDVD